MDNMLFHFVLYFVSANITMEAMAHVRELFNRNVFAGCKTFFYSSNLKEVSINIKTYISLLHQYIVFLLIKSRVLRFLQNQKSWPTCSSYTQTTFSYVVSMCCKVATLF